MWVVVVVGGRVACVRLGGIRVGGVRGLVGRVNRRSRNGRSGGLVRGGSSEVGGVSDASLNNVRHDS